jgi:hypothetical protein
MTTTTYQSKSIWGKLWDKNFALSKLDSAELNLSRAIRNGYPERDIEQARSEYAYRQIAYRPYCTHDWVDMSEGQGDDVREIVTCCTCGQDKAEWDRAQSTGVDVEDLLP